VREPAKRSASIVIGKRHFAGQFLPDAQAKEGLNEENLRFRARLQYPAMDGVSVFEKKRIDPRFRIFYPPASHVEDGLHAMDERQPDYQPGRVN
jgi:hypothetical protein